MIFIHFPAQVPEEMALGHGYGREHGARSYFVSCAFAHAVRIATAASTRAEMITFFMTNRVKE